MAGEILKIPVGYDFTPGEADAQIEQERLKSAWERALKLKFPSFEDAVKDINNPANLGRNIQAIATHPGLESYNRRFNRFTQTGQTPIEEREQRQLLQQQNQLHRQGLVSIKNMYGAFNAASNVAGLFATGGRGMSTASMLYGILGGAVRAGIITPGVPATAASTGTSAAAVGAAGNTPSTGAITGTATTAASSAASATAAGALSKIASAALTKLGPVGATLAALAAIGLGANEVTSTIATNKFNLQGAGVGTSGTTLFNRMLDSSLHYRTNPSETTKLYEQLGTAGVPGQNIQGVASAALAFSRATGMDTSTTGQMAGALATGGQMSPDQVAQVFDAVYRGSTLVGQSMTRLAQTLQDFSKTTGATALGVKGQMALIATQGVLGNQLGVQVAAPLQNAIGPSAMKLAGFLRISQDDLRARQQGAEGGIAGLMTLYLRQIKQYAGNGPLARRENIFAAINQGVGGLDLSQFGVSQQRKLIDLGLTNPDAFYNAYEKLSKHVQPSANDLRANGQRIAAAETPLTAAVYNAGINVTNRWLESISKSLTDIGGKLENAKQHATQNLPSLPSDIAAFLEGAAKSLLPQNWLKDFTTSPIGGSSLLDAIGHALDLSSAHASGSMYRQGSPGFAPGGGAMTGGIPYQPKGALDPTRYQAALALNQALPAIPWQVFYAWAQGEGNPGAYQNNPLNIPYYANIATLTSHGETTGAYGTGSYPSITAGAQATAAFLKNNPNFAGILQAATSGNPLQILHAIMASPWASSHYANDPLTKLFTQDFAKQSTNITVTINNRNNSDVTVKAVGGGSGAATSINLQRTPAGRAAYAPGAQGGKGRRG